MDKKLLFITFGNAGGSGRSTLARVAHFFAEEKGLTTQIVDADPGNRSISRVITSSDAIVFGAKASVGSEVVEVHQAVEVVIIDCGANSSTEAYDIIPLLKAAKQRALSQERHTVGLIPVSPNKPGAVGSARVAAAAFEEAGIDVHVILNDVDGSANFIADGSARLEGVPVPRLSSGFMAVMNREQRSFHEMISAPPSGFDRAIHYVADWLERCSRTKAFAPYFGFDSQPLSLGRPKPARVYFPINTLHDASDPRLKINEEGSVALTRFLKLECCSPEFLDAATRFRQAFLDYQNR